MKRRTTFLCIGLLSLTLTACTGSKTVTINGNEKTVSREFIKIITKRNQDKIKLALPKSVKPLYDINYKKEDIKVYYDHGNGLVRNDTDWYGISEEEFKTIEKEAK